MGDAGERRLRIVRAESGVGAILRDVKDRAFDAILNAEAGSEVSEMVNMAREIEALRRRVLWQESGDVDWDENGGVA